MIFIIKYILYMSSHLYIYSLIVYYWYTDEIPVLQRELGRTDLGNI